MAISLSSISDTLFGDQGEGAAQEQSEQNREAREFMAQQVAKARGDILSLFDTSAQSRQQGTQGALDVLGGAIPQQLQAFSQGNVLSQQALTQGLPQFQNALLGLPVDAGALAPAPQSLSGFNLDFLNQQLAPLPSLQQQSGDIQEKIREREVARLRLREIIGPNAAPLVPEDVTRFIETGAITRDGARLKLREIIGENAPPLTPEDVTAFMQTGALPGETARSEGGQNALSGFNPSAFNLTNLVV